MNDLNSGNFGLLISYVLPGAATLWGFGYLSSTVRSWFSTTSASGPTIAGFLAITLVAVGFGLVTSTVRWMTVDAVHSLTGLRRPPFNYARLAEKIAGFDLLVRHHYEYYKFHANMLVAVVFCAVARHFPQGQFQPRLDAFDAAAVALAVVFFVGSRDNLRNYYRRTQTLLGSR